MKKSLVVLLIAVLALSAVFAADVAITVEGDVSASYVVDFDDGITGTYNVPELNGALAWELVLPVAKAGSEYPYIDVAGEIEVDLADVAYYLTPAVDFSTFAIVGEDWNVNFLAKIGTVDYAVSAIDSVWYNPTNAYPSTVDPTRGFITGRAISSPLTYRWSSAAYKTPAVAISKDGVGTLTFVGTKTLVKVNDEVDRKYFYTRSDAMQYAEENGSDKVTYDPVEQDPVTYLYYVVGRAASEVETTTYAVEGESAELKLADNITTQFGFGFAKKNAKMNAGFSTKSSYEDILTVAADFGYDFKAKENNFSVDVASSFKYEMVSVDVYFANASTLSFYQGKDLYQVAAKKYYGEVSRLNKDRVMPLLSAKASVEVEEIGTTFTFTGKDILEAGISLAYKAVNTYFDNYTFTFGTEAVKDSSIVFDSVSFLAEADYAEEVGVTSYAGITAYRDTRAEAEKSFYFYPVFEVGFAYDKNGFSFSVDFSSLKELNYADYAAFEKDQTSRDYYSKMTKGFENTSFTVKAGYEAEMFTLSGAVEYNTHERSAKSYRDWILCPGLYVSAGIESDKLVDGATLSLDYASGELIGEKDADGTWTTKPSYGSVTAAVTVEF